MDIANQAHILEPLKNIFMFHQNNIEKQDLSIFNQMNNILCLYKEVILYGATNNLN